MVFGKTKAAAAGLHRQFRARTVRKTYLAIVAGVPLDGARFVVDAPLVRRSKSQALRPEPTGNASARGGGTEDWGDNYEWCVDEVLGAAKASKTEFEVVDYTTALTDVHGNALPWAEGGASLLRCFPQSGRTHQIRIHAAHRGHGLLGDEVYGVCPVPAITRQALHADSLELNHPVSGEPIVLRSSAVPEDFTHTLKWLGLSLLPSTAP
jgi:23S rRNA pseudouridine1911/1915/1917 synthase